MCERRCCHSPSTLSQTSNSVFLDLRNLHNTFLLNFTFSVASCRTCVSRSPLVPDTPSWCSSSLELLFFFFFFFFFGGAMWHGNVSHGYVRLTTPAWCVGVYTLLVGECIWGNALCTHLLAQTSVGLAPSRRARWPYLCRPGGRLGVLPTKTPGCLHQSRWRSSLFVEHFAQVSYTFLVFSAFLSYRNSLVSKQSICILSLIFLYHRFLTVSSAW